MNRFIKLKNANGKCDLINAQHIATVEDMYDGNLQIRMLNGMKYVVEEREWDNIVGKDHIAQIVEVKDIVAIISDGVEEVACPIIALALTAEGKVRALAQNCHFADFFDFESIKSVMPIETYMKAKKEAGTEL